VGATQWGHTWDVQVDSKLSVALLAQAGMLLNDGPILVDIDSAEGESPAVIERAARVLRDRSSIAFGVARGSVPSGSGRILEELTTSVVGTGDGIMTVAAPEPEAAVSVLLQAVAANPRASAVLGQVLRSDVPSPAAAIWVESLAYSALMQGEEFLRWRGSLPVKDRSPSVDAVRVQVVEGVLRIVIDRPERRNALDAAARGALSDAFDIAIADGSLRVELAGEGPVFCSGGDLDEFGAATDPSEAHRLRLERGPALRALALSDRMTAFVHGACVGSGIELPAFAGRVIAASGATFRLPEVSMGLIPGAGGTFSVSRRIGRWRAAWWMLTGSELSTERASSWGLVDDVD